jgi:toxin ParE1/3/4
VSITFRIEITEAAYKSIKEIFDHISLDHPDTAIRFLNGLMKKIDTLDQFPLRCPEIPENQNSGSQYRQMLYGAYRTIFQVDGTTVFIIKIVHGAQLLDPNLFRS